MLLVKARESTDAVWREEFLLVEHVSKNRAQAVRTHEAHNPSPLLSRGPHRGDITGEIGTIINEPVKPSLETRKGLKDIRFDRLDREERDQSNCRPHAQRNVSTTRRMQYV